MRQIFLDTETTGFSPALGHRMVEIACIEVVHGQPTGRVFHHYIDPQCDVPDAVAEIHGLTTDFLNGKRLLPCHSKCSTGKQCAKRDCCESVQTKTAIHCESLL